MGGAVAAVPYLLMYSGRFAPSPTGPLHLGSLLAATASWIDARAHQGSWIVRIEDIDPPREVANSDKFILQSLNAHGLYWDGEVEYQSSRIDLYLEHLEQLKKNGVAYACICSRSDIARMGGVYDGRCRSNTELPEGDFAWRFQMPDSVEWQDIFAGDQIANSATELADPAIWRRDGLVAYHLAAAVDDLTMSISHIIRGADLLDSTTAQLAIIDALGKPRPQYGHIPVLIGADGQKLSKQNHAEALDDADANRTITKVLDMLGQKIPADLRDAPVANQLDWATVNWKRNAVPQLAAISL